jgi:hypothetical protein
VVRARAPPTRPGDCKIEFLGRRRALRRSEGKRREKPAEEANVVRDHSAMADKLENPEVGG